MIKKQEGQNQKETSKLWQYFIVFLITFVLVYSPQVIFRGDLAGLIQTERVCRTSGTPFAPFDCTRLEISGNQVMLNIKTDTVATFRINSIEYVNNPHNCRLSPETEAQIGSGLVIGHYSMIMDHKTTPLTFVCEDDKVSGLDFDIVYTMDEYGGPYRQWVYTTRSAPQILTPWIILVLSFAVAIGAVKMVVQKKSNALFVVAIILLFFLSHILAPWYSYSTLKNRVLPVILRGELNTNFFAPVFYSILICILAVCFRHKKTRLWIGALLASFLMSLMMFIPKLIIKP